MLDGAVLERVATFKYLGLVFNATADLKAMAAARLAKAKGAQRQLVTLMQAKGWQDKWMRLVLYNVYVRTALLYGCAVWGSTLLRADGSVASDRYTG